MTEIERLIVPISESEPSGSYLKLDRSAYRGLRNSYNTAQSSFRQLVETPDASSDPVLVETNIENWTDLRNVTEDTIVTKSKDIEILGWYLTSQLFTNQPFENLATALPSLNALVDVFWDTLNPTPPEAKIKASDDAGKAREIVEFRTRPLLQLVGESVDSTSFYVPFQMVGLIGDITFGDYLLAERKGNLAALKETALQSFDDIAQETLQHLVSIHSELESAEKNIAERCQAVGATVISFSYVKTNVRDLINAIHFLVGEKFTFWPVDKNYHLIEPNSSQPDAAQAPMENSDTATPTNSELSISKAAPQSSPDVTQTTSNVTNGNPQVITQVSATTINGIVSRDHAFQEIRKIADYFKETEPHSPISFLLERSIRWGYMSLPELLQEMIGGEKNVLEQINQMTGMNQLDKTDLSGKVVPIPSHEQASQVGTVQTTNTTQEPLVSVPAQDSVQNTTDTTQTNDPTTNESSSNLQDFEW
ncbi:type VI secretion system ImpA family N-terminal domain-containing protein [Vibrio makurazakiensis]|uniref:type VI secretion system protein TssA n=1 Tax=Vibrio makurazakiensis TaxID=2910250 RepID=UPI003D10262D